MTEHILIGLASIFVLGVGAQWLAWRLKLPAILLLLLVGFCAGPVAEYVFGRRLLDPDHLLGDLLLPVVSLSVAIILFEGGMTLSISEWRGVGRVVRLLVTVGALVMWVAAAVGARYLLAMDWSLAILLGAILVVTGPTVIGPLLRFVRPIGPVGSVLKWEGIIIDPIGALFAVLVFQGLATDSPDPLGFVVARNVIKTLFFGLTIGFAAAGLLTLMLRRYWIADYLQNAVTLTLVVASFALSNYFQHESGLFTVTVMGMVLGNQRSFGVHHIVEFKENLAVLLISSLFVLLGARLRVDQMLGVDLRHLAFLALLIFVARPLSIAVSTWGSNLSWRERAFLAWMAPRGVVAASVSAVFAISLHEELGYAEADSLVPATFAVIVGTVTVYGLTAAPLARFLGLARPDRVGYLIVGASPVARAVGKALHDLDFQVFLADTNADNVREARLAGLPAFVGSATSQQVAEQLQLTGVGGVLALTPSETVNALAATHYARLFGRSAVYQLAGSPERAGTRSEKVAHELRGRTLFSRDATFQSLSDMLAAGAVVKKTSLTDQFDYDAFRSAHPGAVPLFLINEDGRLQLVTATDPPTPKPGQTLVTLAPASDPDAGRAARAESPADAG